MGGYCISATEAVLCHPCFADILVLISWAMPLLLLLLLPQVLCF
jgi:hypothetical protein